MKRWLRRKRVLRLVKHRRFRDLAISVATLAAGTVALIGADYGTPTWFQVPLYAWLLTVGLPTTLSVVCLAALWGRFEPLYRFDFFVLLVILVASTVQFLVMGGLRTWGAARASPSDQADADSESS